MLALEAERDTGSQDVAYAASHPATPRAVPEIRHAVTDVARRLGAGATACHDIALAVTEACTNVVMHAGAPRIAVSAAPVDEGLRVVVQDTGTGMRPRPDSPGLGLGLAMIARLADRLEVHPGPDDRGTELRLWFSL
jgi:serine/threonine-protein kinase RsbW